MNATTVANLLAAIERWRAAATEFVHFVGWQQKDREHGQAWFDSRPVQNDPRRPDTWAYHQPRSFESETATLLHYVKTHQRELNPEPLAELLTVAQQLRSPNGLKNMPPVVHLEKLLGDAEAVLSKITSSLVDGLHPTPPEHRPRPRPASTNTPRLRPDYKPAAWFTRNTKVPPSRLRKAAKRKTMKVRSMTISKTVVYSVEDATRWWPDDMKRAKA